MKKFNIVIEAKNFLSRDIVITVNHENKLNRVYFISDEGISRHVDMQNLHDCLNSVKRFNVDAFFFMRSRAIPIADMLLECQALDEKFANKIKEKVRFWE